VIIRMLGSCVDVAKQISAVQPSLKRANRVMLRKHLETCYPAAVLDEYGQIAVDELIDALQFAPAQAGPHAIVKRCSWPRIRATAREFGESRGLLRQRLR
jgi:Metal-sensitive transcriptional repressor